jgi:hypothetical protein
VKLVALDRKYWPRGGYGHWCPGCNSGHEIDTEAKNSSGAIWKFNGDLALPSFSPSINIRWGNYVDPNSDPERRHSGVCHYFIKTGTQFLPERILDRSKSYIEFCGDCTHALAGQVVELPDLPPGAYLSSRHRSGMTSGTAIPSSETGEP